MEKDQVPLLSFDTYQTFGKKAYWIFVSKWLETPAVFLVFAIIISLLRRSSFVEPQYQRIVALGSLTCLGISILGFLICVGVARFAFKSQGFSISPDAFKIRRGIMTKQEIAIPYRQIQNVDIQRTFSQQMSGVSTLVIVTAGSDDSTTVQNESKGILETIDKDVALALQEELLRRADIQKVINLKK
jgi:membrane protein YdbS with pleckstrin-like domain